MFCVDYANLYLYPYLKVLTCPIFKLMRSLMSGKKTNVRTVISLTYSDTVRD